MAYTRPMKIFALETDKEKLKRSFCGPDEKIVCTANFHGFLFAGKAIVASFWTVLIVGVVIAGISFGLPGGILTGVALLAWLILVARPLFRSFIDWKFDLLILTTGKLVIINQSSIFRQHVRQMNLENIASVNVETQFGNIFPFGSLCFDLKEGLGERMCLRYIPSAHHISANISDALMKFAKPQPHSK